MTRSTDIADIDASVPTFADNIPTAVSPTEGLEAYQELRSPSPGLRAEDQRSGSSNSKFLWNTLGLLGSLLLHAALVASAFLFATKEVSQGPAGGVPIEVELVVGFVDSVAMEAGSKDGVTEADKVEDAVSPPTDTKIEAKSDPKQQELAETPEPREIPEEVAQPQRSTDETPQTTQVSEAVAPPEVREKPIETAEAEVALPVTPPAATKPEPEKARLSMKPTSAPKPMVVHKPGKPMEQRPTKPVVSQRAPEKPTPTESLRRGNGPQDSRSSSRGGSGGATQFAGQASAASHRAMILAHLARYKQYPSSARAQGIQGRPMVAFRVGPDGSVSGVSLSRTSGASILDHAVVDMVRRAAPFPKGPSVQSFNLGVTYDLR